MSYLEHEPDKNELCGCASCDLTDKYLKEYEIFKTRTAYKTFKINDGIAPDLEDSLNKYQCAGYEMAHTIPGHRSHNRIVVMRSVPPIPPTPIDILLEANRRIKETKGAETAEDTIGPTLGGMQ
jgi:hypothetical protein